MDLVAAKKLNGNLTMGKMLVSWKHICMGHLPGPPPDKSKFLHTGDEYQLIINLIWMALGKQKGASSVDYYKDSSDSQIAVVIGTFPTSVGNDGGMDCFQIVCILHPTKGNATETVFKSAYPARTISPRFTKL